MTERRPAAPLPARAEHTGTEMGELKNDIQLQWRLRTEQCAAHKYLLTWTKSETNFEAFREY